MSSKTIITGNGLLSLNNKNNNKVIQFYRKVVSSYPQLHKKETFNYPTYLKDKMILNLYEKYKKSGNRAYALVAHKVGGDLNKYQVKKRIELINRILSQNTPVSNEKKGKKRVAPVSNEKKGKKRVNSNLNSSEKLMNYLEKYLEKKIINEYKNLPFNVKKNIEEEIKKKRPRPTSNSRYITRTIKNIIHNISKNRDCKKMSELTKRRNKKTNNNQNLKLFANMNSILRNTNNNRLYNMNNMYYQRGLNRN